MATRDPFPHNAADFKYDDRVSFDQVTQTYKLEDELGEEWEWLEKHGKWVHVLDEADVARQQEAYKVPGVDENAPAFDHRKRKAADDKNGNGNAQAKKQKAAPPKQNSAIYITSLPEDVDEDELASVFSKYGIIAESPETNDLRIKLYKDENGKFKGDALVIYNRPESVILAIQMLDETDFRYGQKLPTGPMRVTEADSSYKSQKELPADNAPANRQGYRDREKAKKKKEEMNRRLADWDDDDPETSKAVANRWNKVVILKGMFTLDELEKDPELYIEIPEENRELFGKFGEVTNVTMYDQEEEGIVTVRFSDAADARRAAQRTNGFKSGDQFVEATVADGPIKFKKSKKQQISEEEEARRLENFSNFIEGGGSA